LGVDSENKEDYFKAVELFELAVNKIDLENDPISLNDYLVATDRLVDINTYHLANPNSGIYWLEKRRHYLLAVDEIVKNQKKLIRLYIDFLGDYNRASIEAQSLLGYDLKIDDKCQIIFDLGLSLFELNRHDEALQEISQCLGNIPIQKALAYKLATLEIDLLMAKKRYQDAIYRIEVLKDTFKDLDVEQNLKLTQALAFEEIYDFQSANKVLSELLEDSSYADKGYLRLRLERLKQKETQQAGARLRKPK
jgi:tetratricopeptide (TPR) repeat protein